MDEADPIIQKMAKRMGSKNAVQLLSVLGKKKQFYDAISTNTGQELLKDCIIHVERIMSKILDEKDEEKDRADLRAYKSIINRWSKTLAEYAKENRKFDEIVNVP